MELKGSKTARNLMTAFSGESQARNRYTYYASKARQEGYVQIAAIFEETADQEKEHAKRLFKFMAGGSQEVCDAFPFGVIGATSENLGDAAAGEHHEHAAMYPAMAKEADEEGFAEIAEVFRNIAIAEKGHERRFLALAGNIAKGRVFRRDGPDTVWRCRNCGWRHTGAEAPDVCGACAHPRAYFELPAENW